MVGHLKHLNRDSMSVDENSRDYQSIDLYI